MFLFHPIEAMRERRRILDADRDVRRGIYRFDFYDGTTARVDPLLTYVKLKEIGFDVMSEDLNGVLRGEEAKTRAFFKAACEAFNVEPFDPATGRGATALDAIRLYLGFYRFLSALKKNVPFLRDYAPSLEERLKSLLNAPGGNSESANDSSSSASTSISQPPPPPQESPHTTEPPAPLTDSTLNSSKPSTDETTNT